MTSIFKKIPTELPVLAATVFLLCQCSESGPIQLTEVREIDPNVPLEIPLVAKSDAERFRYTTNSATSAAAQPVPNRPQATASNGTPRLVWDTPEGWTEQPTSQMRDVNLTFGENGEGECYLTRLQGGGGGLVANINRWRGQMGLEDATPEEIAAMPKKQLFNQNATFVDLEGDFGGMGGGTAKKDYKLLGLIYATPNAAITVKLTGPRDLVEANAAKFDAFTKSLDVDFGTRKPAPEPKPKSNANESE